MPEEAQEQEPVSVGTLVKLKCADFLYVGRVMRASVWGITLDGEFSGDLVEKYDTPISNDAQEIEERRGLFRKLLNTSIEKVYLAYRNESDREKQVRYRKSYETLSKLQRYVGYGCSPDCYWFWHWVAVSSSNPRHVSYSWEECWVDTNARRKHTSVSAFLAKAVHKGYADFTKEEIDLISNAIGQYFPDTLEYTFEVVSGQDICKAYSETPSTWSSCMSRHGHSFVRWYAENPETVSLLKIKQGNDYAGRALLWVTQEGMRVLDRVYPSDRGPQIGAAERYAESQGWDYRTNHCCDSACFAHGNHYTAKMRVPSSGDFPYVDSFGHSNDNPRDCSEIILRTSDGDYSFHCTDGSFEGDDDRECCSECEERVNDPYRNDDGDAFCSECYHERYVCLEYRIDGRWFHREAHRYDCVTCSECHELRLDEHVWEVEGRDICQICAEDCVTVCEQCASEILTEGARDFNDESLCQSCYDAVPACSDCEEKCCEEDLVEGLCCDCQPCEEDHPCPPGMTTEEITTNEPTTDGDRATNEHQPQTTQEPAALVPDGYYLRPEPSGWLRLFWRANTERDIPTPVAMDVSSRV